MISFVMLFNANEGCFTQEARYELSPKEALIAAAEFYRGNKNTWTYPKEMPGIYESKIIKGRLLYDLDESHVLYAQEA